jgi:hypothetical protein
MCLWLRDIHRDSCIVVCDKEAGCSEPGLRGMCP